MAEALICTICLSDIRIGRDYFTARCGHTFHMDCITDNANINGNQCPNCRGSIPFFPRKSTADGDKKEKKKDDFISDEDDNVDDDHDAWACSLCTFKNSSGRTKCKLCAQGLRPHMEKSKLKDQPAKHSEIASDVEFQCNVRFCHTRDPSSRTLCDKCMERKYPTTLPTSELSSEKKSMHIDSSDSFSEYDSRPNMTKVERKKLDEKPWYCESCPYEENLPENDVCVCCHTRRRSVDTKDLLTKSSKQSDNFERDSFSKQTEYLDRSATSFARSANGFSMQGSSQDSIKRARNTFSQKTDDDHSLVIVYITDLPIDKSDDDLTRAIRTRLQDLRDIQVVKIQSFANLGVATVCLTRKADKDYLINSLQSFVLFPQDNIKVMCKEHIEVTVYLVFDKGSTPPGIQTITQRWNELFASTQHPKFQILSIQFPNIMKLILFSIEEVQNVSKLRVFEVDDQIARFHIHVDCSYLEELPRSQPKLDDNRLFCYIATQISMFDRMRTDKNTCQEQADYLFRQLSSLPPQIKELKSKLYIQYNEQLSIAVILASNSLHKWVATTFLNINGQFIFKTTDISSKLIIKPIPLNFPLNLIFDHSIFNQSINRGTARVIGEHLIVDINNNKIYDQCLKLRAFEVMDNGDLLAMRIIPYTGQVDPDNCEINVENWYGTQMQKYRPDITQFDPRHPIYRYMWNSGVWLDQFERNQQDSQRKTSEDDYRKNDFIRRMLRLTAMLNIMGTLRKRKYTVEDSSAKTEVSIDPPNPLITILYTNQSKLFPADYTFTPPFSSTNVRVINEDCLIVYERLALSSMKPLLLNMANATTPGGGYRQGAGAQEENIFRRSNYYMSLDADMIAEQDQYIKQKRNHCSSTGEMSTLNSNQPLYPMDSFGAIYTSGIIVLRDTESQGYSYLRKPLYDVCAVAVAAHRDPPLEEGKPRLIPKVAAETRKKIENLFAIAYKHGHDSLVLSAFGCGAFKNPPEHIALIFKSIILQYAGFFKEIVFAIIDDHNTGGRLNRQGNFLPFQKVFDNYVARPPITRMADMSLGPHRLIRSKSNNGDMAIEEVVLCSKLPCEAGSNCENMAEKDHCKKFSHPPICPLGPECKEHTDDVHERMFYHRKKCSDQGQCVNIDARHLADFDHPDFCLEKGLCVNIKIEHLNQYRHVPICDKGVDCDLKLTKNVEHLLQYRHCKRSCKFGGNCVSFHDEKHIKNEYHPFNPPCPFTPFSCLIYTQFLQSDNTQNKSKNDKELDATQKHCYRYSHVCPQGRLCKDQSDLHLSMAIHILRRMCPNENSCSQKMEDDHLNSFSHDGIPDIRFLCNHRAAECSNRFKPDHIVKYRHNHTLDYLGVAKCFGINSSLNFVQNQSEMTANIRNYVEKTYRKSWKRISVPGDLLDWIAALQPIHRCKATIFESILVHGHVMSRSYMEKLNDPSFVAQTVQQHRDVRKLLANYGPAVQSEARQFIQGLVNLEYGSNDLRSSEIDGVNTGNIEYYIHSKENILKQTLTADAIQKIRLCAKEIAQASIKLRSNKTGIGHSGDLIFGTNEQVFSILGPHTGVYYGDIVIIFKRDIMLHPDSNFTMQAATMYTSKTYDCRPWLKKTQSAEDQVQQFNRTKLHCSVPNYDYVTALELMAITGAKRQTMDVGLGDIIFRWKEIDSHQVIESHLPQLIPLNYIDHVYIPKNIFESLSIETQQKAHDLFPTNLTVTPHVVDTTLDLLPFTRSDESRKEYHNYIMNRTFDSIKRQQEQNAISSTSQILNLYGMVVSIPATDFTTLTTNPLTITQSIDQYKSQSKMQLKSTDSIYIYWKALRGDFMVVLTNDMIEHGKIQPDLRYLTCYVAPFATNTSDDTKYHENFTYINNSSPLSHQTVLEQEKFLAASNTFHKGCNPDDFNLYCLKLNYGQNQVSLINAGVNGIYNHTIIKGTTKKCDFGLDSLNYIHITAGRQSVSIRNLIISPEWISTAHPTFSKEQSVKSTIRDTQGQHLKQKRDSVDDASDDDENSVFSRLSKPFVWMKDKIFGNNGDRQDLDDHDDDNDTSKAQPRPRDLLPCRDSIYCLDQYSSIKSVIHNTKYFHPCRFTDLCQHINQTHHCKQFTHHRHHVPKCPQDNRCIQLANPVHRYSYRHTDLPDLLYPCRDQKQCRDNSQEHRKKYFHGEKINLSTDQIIIMSEIDDTDIPKSKPSNPYSTNMPRKSSTTTSWHTSMKQSSTVWSRSDEESDDEDLVRRFYNDDAGKSNIANAGSYDQYGNPTGRKYDLGRDGAYTQFSILIGQFYDFDMQKPIDALKVKGYQVKHVKTENECIAELASSRHHIAWIISTNQIQNPSFTATLTTFHSSGGAIFLFADNTPYTCHASEFLNQKFGITVQGDYYGSKILTYEEKGHLQTGHFGQHEIFTGITNLYEGITICHPVYSTPASQTTFVTIATATDGNSSIAVYDPPSTLTEGRLCLDCGFTKLFYNWDDAGTARYIVNVSCWLLGIEKRLKSKKKHSKQ